MPDCKFCGEPCETLNWRGQELEICGPCYAEWKKIAGRKKGNR